MKNWFAVGVMSAALNVGVDIKYGWFICASLWAGYGLLNLAWMMIEYNKKP